MTRGVIGRVVLGVWLGCVTAAAQLPPEIMADRHMIRLDRLISENRHREAYELTGEMAAFFKKHDLDLPHEFYFKQARIASSLGLLKEAITALHIYLDKAGKEGARYVDALDLLDRTEEKLREVEAESKRIEAEVRRVETLRRERVELVRRQLDAAAVVLPRDTLNSGGWGPEMVKIGSGRFKYKQRSRETLLGFDRPFAISKYEVTRGEFERFVKSSRYRTDAEKGIGKCEERGATWKRPVGLWDYRVRRINQTDDHPVVCVTQRDAMAYTNWLSQETGHKYRLPSPPEWQYAARAGSIDAMDIVHLSTGVSECIPGANLNCDDDARYTAAVGSFPSTNGVGLRDMIGNVSELVLGCFKSGSGAITPTPWHSHCDRPMYAGSSWNTNSPHISGVPLDHYVYQWMLNEGFGTSGGSSKVGFRVVRELPPNPPARN